MEYVMAEGTHSAGNVAWPDLPLVTPMANSPARSSLGGAAMSMRKSEPRTPTILEAPGAVEHVTPPTGAPNLDIDEEEAPLRFQRIRDQQLNYMM
jgi:hypothetical protein